MSTTIDRAPSRSTDTPLAKAAAVGACGILLGFAGLQVALAAGVPLGEHVWSGTQDRQLPSTMGLVSGGAAVALTSAAWVVARRGGLIHRPGHWLTPATWGIAGYLALNSATSHRPATSSASHSAGMPSTAATSWESDQPPPNASAASSCSGAPTRESTLLPPSARTAEQISVPAVRAGFVSSAVAVSGCSNRSSSARSSARFAESCRWASWSSPGWWRVRALTLVGRAAIVGFEDRDVARRLMSRYLGI